MTQDQQEYLNRTFLGKEDPDLAFKKPMTNNLKEIEEPSEGTKLGTYLRVLYCLGYGQGYEDGASKSEMNSNHNKDDYVSRIYSDISTLINQKEKEHIEKVEKCIPREKDSNGTLREQIFEVSYNQALQETRDRIKQLKEELNKEVV